MDGLVNPKRGWISNANQDPNGQSFDNDPLNELRPGGGIRYITPGHSDGNRNARVTKRLQETLAGGDVSFSEMTSIQADQKLNDAEVLTPYITAALRAAQTPGAPPALAALGADPKVQEAVARLTAWQFSTPTGIPRASMPPIRSGPAPADPGGDRRQRRHDDLQPVARSRAGGDRGRSAPGPRPRQLPADSRSSDDRAPAPARDRRHRGLGDRLLRGPTADTAVLGALKAALDLAASPAFVLAAASTNLADYRWGKLHRIVFRHRSAARSRSRPARASPTSAPACRASPPTVASAPSTPRRTVRARRP